VCGDVLHSCRRLEASVPRGGWARVALLVIPKRCVTLNVVAPTSRVARAVGFVQDFEGEARARSVRCSLLKAISALDERSQISSSLLIVGGNSTFFYVAIKYKESVDDQ
jgi:hypothetical protein